MVDKAFEDLERQKALSTFGLDVADVLCEFHFNDHECVVVQHSNDESAELYMLDGNSFLEVSRFEVNGCCCAILRRTQDRGVDDADLSDLLSARELQIATLVALGCPNKLVADKLRISEWTVATHLRRIFAKLHVDTRAAMTYRCASLICKQGIIKK